MKLSIIIASYNTFNLTKKCIESILKNKPSFKFEIIVVDDGSTDDSASKLRKHFKGIKNVIVIENLKNSGYVRTNNRGLIKSKGEYKLLLNSDTVVHQAALDQLVEFASKTADAGVVGSKLLNSDKSVQKSCYHFPTIFNVINYQNYAPATNEAVAVDAVVGASFLITPKAYKLVGGLNPKYVSYFEDLDYCREVYRKGLKVYYLPSSIVTHYHGQTFKKLSDKDNQWKKLIPSSIAYHGYIKHYILFIISWLYQKMKKLTI